VTSVAGGSVFNVAAVDVELPLTTAFVPDGSNRYKKQATFKILKIAAALAAVSPKLCGLSICPVGVRT
jgi:hypothetical protein